eukprot:COSAG02_NODE_4728_length_5045_cov_9.058835_1_plen_29_part_10
MRIGHAYLYVHPINSTIPSQKSVMLSTWS